VGESGAPGNRRSAVNGVLELMFLGQYEHTIDSKGRMTIPVKFREMLIDGAFITAGFENNLMVLTADVFNRLYERINAMSITSQDARSLRRLMFSQAVQVEVDKAGRILLPQYLRDRIKLDSQAIVIGTGGFFEIWNPEDWKPEAEELFNGETNAKRYETLDLSL